MSGGPAAPVVSRLVELADGVHAHLQPPGGWCLSNSGLVVGDGGVLVVDTAATQRRAESLRDAVAGLGAGDRHVVVNTHHHGDHVFGNAAFGPQVPVIAHERTRVEIEETGYGLLALWPDVDWGDIRLRLPTITYRDRMTLYAGDAPVELVHVGPAHTTNDTVVWLPGPRVLFAGDVVLNGCTPFVLMGSVRGTRRALAYLRTLDAAVIVGGHGDVGGPELIDHTEQYLVWIEDLAARGHAAGLTPLELARDAGPPPQEGLLDPERLVANLHRAYDEIDGGELGRPLDVVGVFTEMVEFNGGVLPTCLA